MLYNTFFPPEYLQICQKAVPLSCVFHSIRFKVNKGWAQRSPFFMPLRQHFRADIKKEDASARRILFGGGMAFEMRLDYQDSNLDKQNQNLLCYHYTIVQTQGFPLKSGAKIGACGEICKHLTVFFSKKARITRKCTDSNENLPVQST